MKAVYIFIIILIITSCESLDAPVDKKKLLPVDYRIFQGTSSWELAKAVYYDDHELIKKLVKVNKVNIDFQEPQFGRTLLMLAVNSEKIKTIMLLLDLGANPNIHDTFNGTSAIIQSADEYFSDQSEIIKLLLTYGANPNDEQVVVPISRSPERHTPLSQASSRSLNVVKILVDAGADINHSNETNTFPLAEAVKHEKYDIVLYLLQKGANPNRVIYTTYPPYPKDLYICDYIKEYESETVIRGNTTLKKIKELLSKKGIQC